MRYLAILLLNITVLLQAGVTDYLQFNLDSKWKKHSDYINISTYIKIESADTLVLLIRAIPVQQGITAEKWANEEIIDRLNRNDLKERPQPPFREAIGNQEWYIIDLLTKRSLRQLQAYYADNSMIVEVVGNHIRPNRKLPENLFYRTLRSMNVKVKPGAFQKFFAGGTKTNNQNYTSQTDKIVDLITGSDYKAYFIKAEDYFKMDNYKKAALYYEKVLYYAPDSEEAKTAAVNIAKIKEKIPLAENKPLTADEIKEKSNSLFASAIKAVSEGNYSDGFSLFKEYAYLDYKNGAAHYHYGGGLFGFARNVYDKEDREKGKIIFSEVERELSIAVKYYTVGNGPAIEKGLAWLLLGDINLYINKNKKKAGDCYKAAVTADPLIKSNPDYQTSLKNLNK